MLVTVAMIGILAAIAIPAYQDYTIRAQVSEGLNLSGGVKAAVTEYVQENREWPANNVTAGVLPADEISGTYVSRVAVEEGAVTITYGNNAHQSIQGLSLVLVPDGTEFPTVIWECFSPDIAPKWVPAACRGN